MMKIKEQFIEFIQNAVKRPAMYKINRVEDIELIFIGYQHALTNTDEREELKKILISFRVFVNMHFESKTDSGWERLIRFYSGSDKHSLELFSDVFNLYLAQEKVL